MYSPIPMPNSYNGSSACQDMWKLLVNFELRLYSLLMFSLSRTYSISCNTFSISIVLLKSLMNIAFVQINRWQIFCESWSRMAYNGI